MKKVWIASILATLMLLVPFSSVNAVTIIQEESNEEPISENGDSTWLATLRMDFSDEIYNDKITHFEGGGIPVGEYYIEVVMDFECPSNRKIEINYHYSAKFVYLYFHSTQLVFCDKSDSFTIINGSNPHTVHIKYEKHLDEWYFWIMKLLINATLKVYEYNDGKWIQISEDYTDKSVDDVLLYVYPKEISDTFNEQDCNCNPISDSQVARFERLLNRVENRINFILLKYGHIPEVKEKCEEILSVINSWEPFDIICGILTIIKVGLETMLIAFQGDIRVLIIMFHLLYIGPLWFIFCGTK